MILAIAFVIALGLGLALRAVALPVVVVLADLLTAAATFGVLQLLFGGANPPLGGPGYLDPMSMIGIFAAIFGVSLIFLVDLLVQARDALVRGASPRSALDAALRRTAAASTGAGLLMVAAVVPFATSGLLTVSQFGVAFAIAVTLDAFLVRPVLLPAAAEVLGRRAWWPTRVGPAPSEQPASPEIPPSSRSPRMGPGGGDHPQGPGEPEPVKERIT